MFAYVDIVDIKCTYSIPVGEKDGPCPVVYGIAWNPSPPEDSIAMLVCASSKGVGIYSLKKNKRKWTSVDIQYRPSSKANFVAWHGEGGVLATTSSSPGGKLSILAYDGEGFTAKTALQAPEGESIASMCWANRNRSLVLALYPSSALCFLRVKDRDPENLENLGLVKFADYFDGTYPIMLTSGSLGGALFAYSRNKLLRFQNSSEHKVAFKLRTTFNVPMGIRAIIFDDSEDGLFTIEDNIWRYWKMDSSNNLTQVAITPKHEKARRQSGEYTSIAISPSGKYLATGGRDNLCCYVKEKDQDIAIEITCQGISCPESSFLHSTLHLPFHSCIFLSFFWSFVPSLLFFTFGQVLSVISELFAIIEISAMMNNRVLSKYELVNRPVSSYVIEVLQLPIGDQSRLVAVKSPSGWKCTVDPAVAAARALKEFADPELVVKGRFCYDDGDSVVYCLLHTDGYANLYRGHEVKVRQDRVVFYEVKSIIVRKLSFRKFLQTPVIRKDPTVRKVEVEIVSSFVMENLELAAGHQSRLVAAKSFSAAHSLKLVARAVYGRCQSYKFCVDSLSNTVYVLIPDGQEAARMGGRVCCVAGEDVSFVQVKKVEQAAASDDLYQSAFCFQVYPVL